MATPMNSAQFRQIVEPVLNAIFDGIYEQRKDEWKAFLRQDTGTPRAYHEEPVMYSFGAAPEMPEGTQVTYATGGVLYTARYTYKVYGLGFAITKVLVEDGEHMPVGKMFSKALAQSMVETKETLAANILNRAFSGSYLGGDGKALCATDHPLASGSASNRLATDAALSQTSVEQMLIQIRNATDNNGKKIRLTAQKLIVPTALQFQAEMILKSTLRPDTANNNINPVKSMNMLPEGFDVISRLTSTTAWWMKTGVEEGMKLMMRRPLQKSMEGDFETDSMKYKATERYGMGWTDWRDIYGTTGA